MSNSLTAATVRITGHRGDEIEAYQARPEGDEPRGGVVVIHHTPGDDRATKEIARPFAELGYDAICPNLYTRAAPGAAPAARAAAGPLRRRRQIPRPRAGGRVGANPHRQRQGVRVPQLRGRRPQLLHGRPSLLQRGRRQRRLGTHHRLLRQPPGGVSMCTYTTVRPSVDGSAKGPPGPWVRGSDA